jgi:oxygen-dependent protoporphyrinogen oxidase
MNVVVIGAGLAGLAAAWRLQAAGHEVSVLERSEHVGGRIGVDVRGEWRLDRTLETLHAGDRHLLAWIRELGLAGSLLPLRPLQIAQVHRGVSSPIDPQSLSAVAGIPGVRWRDAARLLRWPRLMARYAPQLDPTAPERAAALDFRSVADFARLYFGESVYAHWVAPEVTDAFGGEATERSRVAALLGWRARGTGTSRSTRHGVLRRPLAAVAHRAAEQLAIHLGVEATRVDERPAGGFDVACRGRAGGRGELAADAVVVATSAAAAGELVAPIAAPAERDHFAAASAAPEIVLSLALSAPPTGMPQRVRVPRTEDQPLESLLLEPGLAEGRAPRGAGIAVLRATTRFARTHARSADDVVEKGLLAGFARLFPAAAARVEDAVLHRHAAAVPCFDVGAYRALERFRRVQADRRALGRWVYFAGDHLIGPGAEGAVVSGFRAAADLLADATAR